MTSTPAHQGDGRWSPKSITRPDPALLTYYIIMAVLTLPLFPITFLAGYFRYITLRYAFEDDGVSMSVGLLFKREIQLTYRRIQDIHVTRNLLQRWMGLASIQLQTAAGAATPEMTIEGIREPDKLRDYLYAKMRGARGDHEEAAEPAAMPPQDEALALLHEIRDLLQHVAAAKEPHHEP